MNSSHRGLLQRPAWLQGEGKEGEKGHPRQGAAGRFSRTTPRALLGQPLSASASMSHDCKACLESRGAVGDGEMVRNQEDESTDRCNCAPP